MSDRQQNNAKGWATRLRLAAITISIALAALVSLNAAFVPQSGNEASDSGLRLTITILNQKSCEGNASQYSEVFNIATRYTNDGKVPQNLSLGSDVPSIVRVARTVEDLKLGKYEVNDNPDFFPADAEGRYLLGEKPGDERSVVLKPGESVTATNKVAIFVLKPNSKRGANAIVGGTHFLQVEMSIRLSQIDAQGEKQSDSEKHGVDFRWIAVLSQPVEFEMPVKPSLEDCKAH